MKTPPTPAILQAITQIISSSPSGRACDIALAAYWHREAQLERAGAGYLFALRDLAKHLMNQGEPRTAEFVLAAHARLADELEAIAAPPDWRTRTQFLDEATHPVEPAPESPSEEDAHAEDFLTVAEVAELLKRSTRSIQRQVTRGQIPGAILREGAAFRPYYVIPRSSLHLLGTRKAGRPKKPRIVEHEAKSLDPIVPNERESTTPPDENDQEFGD